MTGWMWVNEDYYAVLLAPDGQAVAREPWDMVGCARIDRLAARLERRRQAQVARVTGQVREPHP